MSQHTEHFEKLKKFDENGVEFWSARDLVPQLDYREWRNFNSVLLKAKMACQTSGHTTSDHFVEVNKMVSIGSGAQRQLPDVHLSRYACYLIVQNGDPSKPAIAAGQTYFAVQTRRQELADEALLEENQKRQFLRNELKEHNKKLNSTAKIAGVTTSLDFAIFQNHGYKGLYGGLDNKMIHRRKGLQKNQKILDHMGSTELAANLFRATQAEEKLRRDNIQGKNKANQTHFDVGQKVRQTISELGGLMPENLPTPDTGISQIELASNKSLSAPQSHSLMASTKRKFIKFDETQYIKLRRGPKKTWVVIWSYKFSGESSKQFSSESFKTFDEGYNRYSYTCDNLIKNGYKPID